MSLDDSPFLPLGPHAARCVGTDVLHVVWDGDVLPEHVLQLGEIIGSMAERNRGIFVVSDCTDLRTPGGSARKAAANDPNTRWMREIVMIGATVKMRILIGIVNRGIRAIGISKAPVTFVDSEAEAMAHVERRRAADASR